MAGVSLVGVVGVGATIPVSVVGVGATTSAAASLVSALSELKGSSAEGDIVSG